MKYFYLKDLSKLTLTYYELSLLPLFFYITSFYKRTYEISTNGFHDSVMPILCSEVKPNIFQVSNK